MFCILFLLAIPAFNAIPGQLNGTNFPIPVFSISTRNSKTLSAGQGKKVKIRPFDKNVAIYVDASSSILPSIGTTYYFLYSWGDFDNAGLPSSTLTNGARPSIVSHVYKNPGNFTLNLTISDQPFSIVNSIAGNVYSGMLSTGYPAATTGMKITLSPSLG